MERSAVRPAVLVHPRDLKDLLLICTVIAQGLNHSELPMLVRLTLTCPRSERFNPYLTLPLQVLSCCVRGGVQRP